MNPQSATKKITVDVVAVTQPVIDPSIPDAEALMAYTARVSNPKNQLNNDTADKLLAYCIRHGHWSVFEMANVVLHIQAPRDISRQILRHKSNAFQEFSQRYADVSDDMFCLREMRMQDDKNRQNSNEIDPDHPWHAEWVADQRYLLDMMKSVVDKWRDRGVAKECTRVYFPEGLTMSSMYVNGNVRDLLHYVRLRKGNGTQKEHMDVAFKAAAALEPIIPNTIKAFEEVY